MKTDPPSVPFDDQSLNKRRRKQESDSAAAEPALLKEPVDRAPGPEMLAELAAKIQGVRERRRAFPSGDQISETGWEMLIELFRSDVAKSRITVSNLCEASHAPATTALRWLDRLEQMGLVCRRGNKIDRRIIFVELEPLARSAMYAYFCELWLTLYGHDFPDLK